MICHIFMVCSPSCRRVFEKKCKQTFKITAILKSLFQRQFLASQQYSTAFEQSDKVKLESHMR